MHNSAGAEFVRFGKKAGSDRQIGMCKDRYLNLSVELASIIETKSSGECSSTTCKSDKELSS